MSVLEETIEKLSFLGSITPDVLQHRDELSKFVGDEISRIIHEQRQLEARYEELVAERSALKGLSNKSKYKEVQNEIQDVSRALRESTKQLCRNLKENPNISGNLIKIQRERAELVDILNQTCRELHDSGTYGTMTAKVNEDKLMQQEMRDIVLRERSMTEAVKKLDHDLGSEKREHLARIAEQKNQIAGLKEQLQAVKGKTNVDARYFKKEAHAMTSAVLRGYQQSERSQEARIKEMERKLETENVVHKETVEFLLRKQRQIQEDLDLWTAKYDRDYGDLEGRYKAIKDKQMRNRERLEHLQARKKAEDEQDRQERKLRETQKELQRQEKAKMQEKRYAASLILRILRENLRRQKAQAASKGKKKKGGKKKKK